MWSSSSHKMSRSLKQLVSRNNNYNHSKDISSLLLLRASLNNKLSLCQKQSYTQKVDRVVGPLGFHKNSNGELTSRHPSMDGDTLVVSARASDVLNNPDFHKQLEKEEERRNRELMAAQAKATDYRKRPKIFWYVAAIFGVLFAQEMYSYYSLRDNLDPMLDMLKIDESLEKRLAEQNIPIQLSLSRVRHGGSDELDQYVCFMNDALEMMRNMSYKDHGVQLLMQKKEIVVPRLLLIVEKATREEIKNNAAHILFMLTRYEAFSKEIIKNDGIERLNTQLVNCVYSAKFKNQAQDKLADILRRVFIQLFDHKTVNQDIAKNPHSMSLVVQMAQFDNPSWLSQTALSCLENICDNHVQFVQQVGSKGFADVEKILITKNGRFMAGLKFLVENGKTKEVKERAAQVLETLTKYSTKDALKEEPEQRSIVTRVKNQIAKEYGVRDYLAVWVFVSLIPLTIAYMAKNYAKRGAPKEFFYKKMKLVGGIFLLTDFVIHPYRFAFQSYFSPTQRERLEPDRNAFEKWGLLTAAIYGLHLFAYYSCPYAHAVYLFRFMPFMTLDTYTNAFDGTNRLPYFTFQKFRKLQMDIKASTQDKQ